MARKVEIIIELDGRKIKGEIRGISSIIKKEFKKSGKSVDTFGSKLKGLAKGAIGPLAGAFAAAAIAQQIGEWIGSASDFEESLNKVLAVFGPMGDEMVAFTKNSAKQFGISQGKALELAGGIGSVVKALGFTIEETANWTKEIITLSADIGSFNNLDTDVVIRKITSALTGEREGLKSLGIVVNENRIKQEAASQGITGALSTQQKATLTLSLIQKDMADSQGDFIKTSKGLANSSKILGAQLADLGRGIGQLLLPIVNSVVGAISGLIGLFTDLGKTDLEKLADELERIGGATESVFAIRQQIEINDALKNRVKTMTDLAEFELSARTDAELKILAVSDISQSEKDILATMKSKLNVAIRAGQETKKDERILRFIEEINIKRRKIVVDILAASGKNKILLIDQQTVLESMSADAINFLGTLLEEVRVRTTLKKLQTETTKDSKEEEKIDEQKLLNLREQMEATAASFKTVQDAEDAAIRNLKLAKANMKELKQLDLESQIVQKALEDEFRNAKTKKDKDAITKRMEAELGFVLGVLKTQFALQGLQTPDEKIAEIEGEIKDTTEKRVSTLEKARDILNNLVDITKEEKAIVLEIQQSGIADLDTTLLIVAQAFKAREEAARRKEILIQIGLLKKGQTQEEKDAIILEEKRIERAEHLQEVLDGHTRAAKNFTGAVFDSIVAQRSLQDIIEEILIALARAAALQLVGTLVPLGQRLAQQDIGDLFSAIGSFFGFKHGGVVPNVNPLGLSGSDTVPALLTPGEVVLTQEQAQTFNINRVLNVNNGLDAGTVERETSLSDDSLLQRLENLSRQRKISGIKVRTTGV